MAVEKPKKKTLTPEERLQADQELASLVAQLDREWPSNYESRLQMGRILYQIKFWLKKWGKNKGQKGKWQSILDARKPPIPLSTANDYVRLWQETQDIPPEDCVLARVRIPQQNGEKNPAESAGLATSPSDAVAKIKAADDDDADKSKDKRIGVECIFVLTMAEKIAFMKAVGILKPLRATQEMYKAVVAAANGVGE
jgi:hypothetical protein